MDGYAQEEYAMQQKNAKNKQIQQVLFNPNPTPHCERGYSNKREEKKMGIKKL